jgi:flagellar biosynthesis/type III secretory pathway M-ring protein FliF/YscJ
MDFLANSLVTAFWFFVVVFVGIPLIAHTIEKISKDMKKAAEERARKKAEEEDARFQREHPEAWHAKEMVKLERERFEAQKQLADQYHRQESSRRNAGLIAGIVRIFLG